MGDHGDRMGHCPSGLQRDNHGHIAVGLEGVISRSVSVGLDMDCMTRAILRERCHARVFKDKATVNNDLCPDRGSADNEVDRLVTRLLLA